MVVLSPIFSSGEVLSPRMQHSFEKKPLKSQGYGYAKQQFVQCAHPSSVKCLSEHSINLVDKSKQQSSLCVKIATFARSIFSTKIISSLVNWTIVRGEGSLDSATQKNYNTIAALTGSCHLVAAMNKAEMVITSFILDTMNQSFKNNKTIWNIPQRAFFGLLKKDLTMFHSIVRFMMSKIYLNMANSKERLEKRGDNATSFTLVDAAACLVEVFNAHLSKIHSKIKSSEEIRDPVKRTERLHRLFAPLRDELLEIMLPEGDKEFPLQWQWQSLFSKYYTRFRNHIMPEILHSLYTQLAIPTVKEDEKKLLSLEGGKVLVSLAKGVSYKVEELIPSLLAMPIYPNVGTDFRRRLVDKAVGIFGSMTNSSQKLQDYFAEWLMRQCVELGKSSEIKLLWKFLGSYSEPILIHIFRRMAEIPAVGFKSNCAPDALSGIMIKLCALTSDFFNANRESIEERIEELTRLGQLLENDSILLSKFRPFADVMLTMMGLVDRSSLPIPEAFKDIALSCLSDLAPKFLLKQYLAIKNYTLNEGNCREKFRVQFFDPSNLNNSSIASQVVSFLYQNKNINNSNMSEAFYQELWTKSGTETFVQTLEGMCAAFSRKIVEGLMKRFGLAEQKMLSLDSNPFMKSAVNLVTSLVETNLLNLLVQIVESTPTDELSQRKGHPKIFLPFQILKRYINMIGKDLRNIGVKLKEIKTEYAYDPDRSAREERKAFSSLANDLHSSVGKNPLSDIPIDAFIDPNAFRNMVWEIVKSDVLPAVLEANYSDIMAWQDEMQNSLDILQKCYHTTHPQWACRVLAYYASDFVRHYLTVSNGDAAKLLSVFLQDYFIDAKDASGNSIAATLHERSDVVEDILRRNMRHLGKSESPAVLQIWPFVTKYMEAIFAKCFSQISLLIRDIEAIHPDFMVDITINILKETSDYFTVLNEQAKKREKEHAYKIDTELLLASFGTEIHNGVPLEPSAPQHEKDRTRLEGWLVPMAYKLLRLAGLDVDDMPIPSSIRRPLGKLIVRSLLPKVLLALDKQALEPRFRDMLMLQSVQMLHGALNDINRAGREEMPDGDVPKTDPKRKNLNELCGAIVLEMVKLIPDTMVQYVFMKEKVKNMSAEVIGNAIMAYLSKWTLLQLIDTVVFKALPNLHPSRWQGKACSEVLVPKRKVRYSKNNKKSALKTVEKFHFKFPVNEWEILLDRDKKLLETKQIRQRLRHGFSGIISSQLFAKSWSFIKAMWNYYQDRLDDFIERHFSENGLQAKAVLDSIFHRFFFDLIGPIIQSLCEPIILLCKFLAEKVQIDAKSDEIIETLHSDTVEHLLNKSIDIVIDTLDKLRKDVREGQPQTDGYK